MSDVYLAEAQKREKETRKQHRKAKRELHLAERNFKYGISNFNILLEMIKNRELDEYDETLNYKDKAVCEAERQRQRDFYGSYPKFVIFANLYVPLFRMCEYGRAVPFFWTVRPTELDWSDEDSYEEYGLWLGQQQNNLELVDIVNESITGIEVIKINSMLRHEDLCLSVAFSGDDSMISSGGVFGETDNAAEGMCRIWNIGDGKEIHSIEHPTRVKNVCFLPSSDVTQGERIVTASGRIIRIRGLEKGAKIIELGGHTADVTSVDRSTDNRWIASSSRDGTLRLWDAHFHSQLWKYVHSTAPLAIVTSIAFSHDRPVSSRFAVVTEGGYLRVFSISEKKLLCEKKAHNKVASCCKFSNDNSTVATCGDDGKICLFNNDGDKFDRITTIKMSAQDVKVFSIDFSRCDRFIAAAADDLVLIFEIATGIEIWRSELHSEHCVRAIAFSNNGKLLASSSEDYSVRIHDVSFLKYRRRRHAPAVVEAEVVVESID
jgi:WD40 repeat protein